MLTLVMIEKKPMKKLLIVGTGGIGTSMIDNLIPALRRVGGSVQMTLMDGDTVEASNLGHQRFVEADIGLHKVDVLAERYHAPENGIEVLGIAQNMRQAEQLQGYDAIVVCVDRPEPRRLVHETKSPWADLRCSGDGWLVMTSQSNPLLVSSMTPDHEPKSCQVEGALDSGNLEFGFAVAAAHGAQWVFQLLRGLPSPTQSMGSLTYGALNFPEVSA